MHNVHLGKIVFTITTIFFLFIASSFAEEFSKWVDKDGKVHYTTSPAHINEMTDEKTDSTTVTPSQEPDLEEKKTREDLQNPLKLRIKKVEEEQKSIMAQIDSIESEMVTISNQISSKSLSYVHCFDILDDPNAYGEQKAFCKDIIDDFYKNKSAYNSLKESVEQLMYQLDALEEEKHKLEISQ